MLLRITSVGCAVKTGVICAPARALPVLGKIRQHGKQHEAAHKGHGLIERQCLPTCRQPARVGYAAVAIHGGGSYRFDSIQQRIAAVGADDFAQQPSKESDIRILGDRRRLS
jgi:hypothetical protein